MSSEMCARIQYQVNVTCYALLCHHNDNALLQIIQLNSFILCLKNLIGTFMLPWFSVRMFDSIVKLVSYHT